MIKKLLPYSIKLAWQLVKRFWADVKQGRCFAYARPKEGKQNFAYCFSLRQELKPNEAKKINLLRAIQAIERVEIPSGAFFSFWKTVGRPVQSRGFVPSRSLVNGEVSDSVGGGLCQLSGLIYYACLFTPLEVVERHSHSLDIYTEETRFAPLGSDATVAYGYKDLIIRNTLPTAIRFSFELDEEFITIRLHHSEPFEANKVDFRLRELDEEQVEVAASVNGLVITHSVYQRLLTK